MANFAAFTASTPSGILTALTVGTRSTSLCTNISIFIALIPFSNLLDISECRTINESSPSSQDIAIPSRSP